MVLCTHYIQPIWDLFTSILSADYDNGFNGLFDIVTKQRGIKWNLTMALFWIRPYDFMPLDTPSRTYLEKIGIKSFDERHLNAENYLKLNAEIKEVIQQRKIKEKNIPEISFNAWEKDPLQGDPTMPGNTLLTKCKALLESTRNLILTGAPGTGKTHLAKQIAEAMGCTPDEIGFVQFHPSYDYTDFVEGLRPVQSELGEGSQIGFERKDGVFKEFCGRALRNLIDSRKQFINEIQNFDEVFEQFVSDIEENHLELKTLKRQKEFSLRVSSQMTVYAIPKTEASTNMGLSKEKIRKYLETGEILDWKPYLTSIGKYIEENYEIIKTSETISQKSFVFIIDEINRGEVAKIFGELFYAIDPGYRGEKGLISTQYQNLVNGGEWRNGFFVPENVYIIGTMNDIDRGVESMDFAFRRRFAWAEVKAAETQYMLDKLDESRSKEAKDCMDRLNKAISETEGFGPAYEIGASYFLKLNQYDGDFQKLWDYHLKGILEEYLRGNPRKEEMMEGFKAAYSPKEEQGGENGES